MRVTRKGGNVTITTDLGGQALVQSLDLNGSANGAFAWQATALAGVTRHGCSDSITPLRTMMGTVGANHGFSQVRTFTNPDGKTTTDLGSTWTDGATTYTLLQITGGKLVIGGPPTTHSSGATMTAVVAPVADLTHVSGATHTGTIIRSTISASHQLYPSVRAVNVTAHLDGGILPEGESTGQVLRIAETYEILEYADLIAKVQANVGTPFESLPVAGGVRMSNLYEMRAPGAWMVSTTVTALTTQSLGQCGFIQSEALLTPSGGSLWRWLPGVNAIGGYDWHTGVNITTYATSQLVTSADLMDSAKPPTWMVEWARDSTGKDILGFAHGYIPDKADGSWAARVASAPSNYWDLRSSKKSYPTAMTSRSLDVGQRVSVQAWRTYLAPSETAGLAVQDAQAGYAFAKGSSVSARPTPIPSHLGRAITPLAEQGLTIAPGVVDADGLTVTGTGHAIAKLT